MWNFVLALTTALCCIALLRSVIEQYAVSAGSANFAVSVVQRRSASRRTE